MKGDELKSRFEFLMRNPSNYVHFIEKSIDIEFKRKAKRENFIYKPKLPSFKDPKLEGASGKISLPRPVEERKAAKSYPDLENVFIGTKGLPESPIHRINAEGRRSTQPILNRGNLSPLPKAMMVPETANGLYFHTQSLSCKSVAKKRIALEFKKARTENSNAFYVRTEENKQTESSADAFSTEQSKWVTDKTHFKLSRKQLSMNRPDPEVPKKVNQQEGFIKINPSQLRDLNRYTPIDTILKEKPTYLGEKLASTKLEDPESDSKLSVLLPVDTYAETIPMENSLIDMTGFRKRINKIFSTFELNQKLFKREDTSKSMKVSFEKAHVQHPRQKHLITKSVLGVNVVEQTSSAADDFFFEVKDLADDQSALDKESALQRVQENNERVKKAVERLIRIAKHAPKTKITSSINLKLEDMLATTLASSLSSTSIASATKRMTSKDFLRLYQIGHKVVGQLKRDAEFLDSLKFFSEDAQTAFSEVNFQKLISPKINKKE